MQSPSTVVQLPNGDRLVVGSTEMSSSIGHDGPSPHLQIALQALGTVAFPPLNPLLLGGNGNDIPEAAAVDPKGNIWIVGITGFGRFQAGNPIVTQKTPYKAVGFVIELDPTGASLLFSTGLRIQNDCRRQSGEEAGEYHFLIRDVANRKVRC